MSDLCYPSGRPMIGSHVISLMAKKYNKCADRQGLAGKYLSLKRPNDHSGDQASPSRAITLPPYRANSAPLYQNFGPDLICFSLSCRAISAKPAALSSRSAAFSSSCLSFSPRSSSLRRVSMATSFTCLVLETDLPSRGQQSTTLANLATSQPRPHRPSMLSAQSLTRPCHKPTGPTVGSSPGSGH